VDHWVNGGATSLDNLMLLCRRHHRAVHEGGVGVVRDSDGAVTFRRPNGAVLEAVPVLQAAPGGLDRPVDDIPVWDGARFDVVYAIDVLYSSAHREDRELRGSDQTVSGSNLRHHLT
jgi:hypothetical protein